MESIEDTMSGIHSWNDVVNHILEMDRAQMAPDPSTPQFMINQLLKQEDPH